MTSCPRRRERPAERVLARPAPTTMTRAWRLARGQGASAVTRLPSPRQAARASVCWPSRLARARGPAPARRHPHHAPVRDRGRVPRARARHAHAHGRDAARGAAAAPGRRAPVRARLVVGQRGAPRGEGRVVAFKPNTQDGLGGLTLRFTRLDSRSKALVDKAAVLRDQRRQSLPPPPPSLAASMHPPPLPSPPSRFHSTPPLPPLAAPDAPHSSVPPGPASSPPAVPPPLPPPAAVSEPTLPIDVAEASAPSLPPASSSPALAAARISSVPPPPPAPAPRPAQPETQAQQLASPPGRDELLRRLRLRARALDASQVARILERK